MEKNTINEVEVNRIKLKLSLEQSENKRLREQMNLILISRSWRYTVSFRVIISRVKRLTALVNEVARYIKNNNGVFGALTKIYGTVKEHGIKGLYLKQMGRSSSRNNYAQWIELYDNSSEKQLKIYKAEIEALFDPAKISIIMPVYNPPIKYLEEAINSVQNQIYENWELCIADDASTNSEIQKLLEKYKNSDARIKVAFRTVNGHISEASNTALSMATGRYVALLDNDDLIPPHALFNVIKVIVENPELALIYSDEDKITEDGLRFDPYFKSQLNYELLLAQNMICHLGVYRRDIVEEIGGFRTGFEGAQDYDLALRILERINESQIIHIPIVLYHWRAIKGSTALNAKEKNYAADAARKAVKEHLGRTGRNGVVTSAPEAPALNRVRYDLPEELPYVSIIIPTRDRADLLSMCLNSIVSKTTFSKFEIIIIDNGSIEPKTHRLFEGLDRGLVKVVQDSGEFNFSRLNNLGVSHAKGDVICLMNNDIEILTHEWLEEMLSFAMQKDIGCVGARLWYPDGRLQHGGVITGIGGIAGHSHKYLQRGDAGYFGRAVLHQSFSVVTAACFVIRRELWENVGGLDESFAVAMNDVDFCLRVQEAGYRNVWTPYAEMTHHESATRGAEDSPEKILRFQREVNLMKARWGSQLKWDPAYNPNLTLQHEDYSLAWPPRIIYS